MSNILKLGLILLLLNYFSLCKAESSEYYNDGPFNIFDSLSSIYEKINYFLTVENQTNLNFYNDLNRLFYTDNIYDLIDKIDITSRDISLENISPVCLQQVFQIIGAVQTRQPWILKSFNQFFMLFY